MPENIFPALYSRPSGQALQERVLSAYEIGAISFCKLWNPGLSDIYLVQTDEEKYILRVYSHGDHTQESVLFEIDALNHLYQKGVTVSVPLAKRDGSFVTSLNAIEGERYAVLFTYAPGGRFQRPSITKETYAYGRTIAQMHTAWDDFHSGHSGYLLDVDHWLDSPLKAFLPVIADRPSEVSFLLQLVTDLKQRLAMLPLYALEQGVSHADLHGGNANITSEQIVTLYDFEGVGYGARVIDLAAFRWSVTRHKEDEIHWQTFLDGYTSHRPVSELSMKAIPLFVVMRHIFLMGMYANRLDVWGLNEMNEQFLDFHLAFIRACADKI